MKGEIRHAYDTGKEAYLLDGGREPFHLQQIENWEAIEYAVQIPENHISE